ncbi:conserved hypothetical protein [Planctopirus limnophila DSM 3776]|uniref:YcfA family protein n=1 Tax=Planctopirus limnophila (strain ATCC 43296 / DSM 3776 / IFAM 1008 / Mu 290) TaxID=521674 RepID=D5SNR6_PLAL2|nr:conserved hypothetical protein [Planctopirus limnophila DSM 3776]
MRHPNKHIRAAIEFALSCGWAARSGGGHAFCIIFCPKNNRSGCQKSVWSTPRDPEAHARDIIRFVEKCPHSGETDD